MINFDDVTKEYTKGYNRNWLQIFHHPYRLLIIGGWKNRLIILSNKSPAIYWQNLFLKFVSKLVLIQVKCTV